MARIIYCHPSQTQYEYHIYTDLDFWDVRLLVQDMATVKRNFGEQMDGDEFPTQIVGSGLSRDVIGKIERRLKKAIISPARHVVVRSMIMDGFFEFDPLKYYPKSWTKNQMLRFTRHRLPLQQSSLSNAYQTVKLSWADENIRVDRIQRDEKHAPVIRTQKEAQEKLYVPSCF